MNIFKKIIHQTSWQLLAKAVSAFSTIILLSVITRTYGENGTGIYTQAFTYLAFFYLASDLGLNGYFLPHFNEVENVANKLFNLRLWISAFLIVLSIVLLPLFPFATPEFTQTVIIGSLTILLNGIFNSANFVFQHNLAYSKSSLGTIASSIIQLIVVIFLAWLHSPIIYFGLAPLLGWLANLMVCALFLRQFYHLSITWPDLNFIKTTIKHAWPVAATLIVNTVYFRVDSFILSGVKNFSDVGNYNLAYQIFQDVLVIPAFIMNAFYPLMLRAMKENLKRFNQEVIRVGLVMGILGILGLFGTIILAPWGVHILTGKGFEGTISSLRILALSFPAFFMTSLLVWVLMAKKLYKQMFIIYFIGFLVNFGLNWIYIPQYSYIAAAWVTCIGEYLILVLQILILYSQKK